MTYMIYWRNLRKISRISEKKSEITEYKSFWSEWQIRRSFELNWEKVMKNAITLIFQFCHQSCVELLWSIYHKSSNSQVKMYLYYKYSCSIYIFIYKILCTKEKEKYYILSQKSQQKIMKYLKIFVKICHIFILKKDLSEDKLIQRCEAFSKSILFIQ